MSFLLDFYLNGQDLEILPEVSSFWYDETTYGASTFHLHVTSSDWAKWDKIVTAGANQVAKLRWGYLEDTIERWTTWKDVLLTPVTFQYASGMVEVEIDSTDAGYSLAEVSHGLSFISKRISQIVKEIVAANGFSARVEETRGLFTLYQGTYTDATFIAEVLLAHAVSNSGRADYNFYIEDGRTVVFAPVDLSRVAATYTVRDGVSPPRGDDVEVLKVTFGRLFEATEGSSVNEVRGFHPFRKELLRKVLNEGNANFSYTAKHRPAVLTSPSIIQLATLDTEDQIDLVSRATWSTNARKLFRTEVTLGDYDIDIRPGQVAKLTIFSPDEQVHWTAGRWVVWKVRQWYRPRGHGTTLYLERRAHE